MAPFLSSYCTVSVYCAIKDTIHLVATDYIRNTTWKDVIVRIDDKKEITTLSSSAEIFFLRTRKEKSCPYKIHLDLYYLHYILRNPTHPNMKWLPLSFSICIVYSKQNITPIFWVFPFLILKLFKFFCLQFCEHIFYLGTL